MTDHVHEPDWSTAAPADGAPGIKRPFWYYYGGKWRAAKHYPPPRYNTIVEPFAGAAGYATRYAHKSIILLDSNKIVCGLWDYLIQATPQDIYQLPTDITNTDDVEPGPARWLVGWWLNHGTSSPRRTASSRCKSGARPNSYWGVAVRRHIAESVVKITHWSVTHGDYTDAPDIEATWFVDPPYSVAGKHYRDSSIDYGHLAEWCRSRRGQVIVCEAAGATWLPFRDFRTIRSNNTNASGKSVEVIWTNE
jgi:hypothetical protein